MENQNDNIIMSRIAFERIKAKEEANDRWRNIIIIVLIILLGASNAFWLYEWNQYDYTVEDSSVSLEADDNSDANYIGNDGDINYGSEDQGEEGNI